MDIVAIICVFRSYYYGDLTVFVNTYIVKIIQDMEEEEVPFPNRALV